MSHIWKPLLHEVAVGTLDSNCDEVNYIVQGCRNGFSFMPSLLSGIDRTNKIITIKGYTTCNDTQELPNTTLSYDYLIIAIGSKANDFNTPGVKENALFLDSRAQAEAIRSRLLGLYLQLQNDQKIHNNVRIAIVGAGATGVELSAELHQAGRLLTHYGLSRLKQYSTEITIIEGADRILPARPERISIAVEKQLERKNIKLLKNSSCHKSYCKRSSNYTIRKA